MAPEQSSKGRLTGYNEAIRTLRNSLVLTDFDRRVRTLMLTSPSPSEGKSTISAHLAMAHAMQGRKTLLIDANEKGETPSHSCFYPHRRDERGYPPSRCVSICTDTTRRGTPLLLVFLSAQTRRGGGHPFSACFCPHRRDEEGISPSRRVSIHTDATGRGSPLLGVFLFTQTREIPSSLRVSTT